MRRPPLPLRFVFVESNTTGTGMIAIDRLLDGGHDVTFLTRTPEKYAFSAAACRRAHERFAVEMIDTNNLDVVREAIRDRQARHGVDALMTFSEFYVEIVAETAASLGLRALGPEAARRCRDKSRTRRALRDARLPTPDFWLVSSESEARAVANIVSYPCVVKPTTDSSSHGVRLVRTQDELLAHCRSLSACTHNVRGQRLAGEVLIESLLDGPEFSVETMTMRPGDTHVIGVTAKHLSDPPHFVETGHDFPAALPAPMASTLADAVLRALDAVGFDFGPAHTEIRWTARGPIVVEINPRLAGGMIPELVARATGIDLLGAWLDLAAGAPIDLTPSRAHIASIRFIIAAQSGRLTRIGGVDEVRQLPTVRDVTITRATGTDVKPAQDAYDRLGFIIAAGTDRAQVTRDVEEALAIVSRQLEVAPHVLA